MKNVKLEIIKGSIKLLDIDDNTYFSKEYKDYVSNSRLSLINPDEDGSREKYKNGLVSDEGAQSFFTLGSAVHQIILQPDDYIISTEINKPSGKMFTGIEYIVDYRKQGLSIYDSILKATERLNYFKGKLDSNISKIIRAKDTLNYYLYRISDKYKTINDLGKEIIYLDSYAKYQAFECIKELNKSKAIKLFKPTGLLEDPIIFNESTLICDIKVTVDDKEIILPTKLKIDNWTLDLESDLLVLNDLKTSYHGPSKFADSFEKFHYYRQMGMYLFILNAYCLEKYNKQFNKEANIVVVGTNKPFDSGVFQISDNHIKKGLQEFKRLITEVAKMKLDEL